MGIAQRENDILVLGSNDSVNTLELLSVSDNSIPDELNGESGFHIYHVRMLSELILTQLFETDGCSLTREESDAISIAS